MKPTHTFEKKLLSCMIAMAISGACLPAMAEEDAPEAAAASEAKDKSAQADEDIEHMEVTGFRSSLKANAYEKKNSDSVREVVYAEDIGKFPDKNVAESLQRVPGVTIGRDFGEGERVSIRGTAPNLNRATLNGHGVATADWFILDQLNASRSFNYLMLPSEVVGKMEVIKSPQADTEEGSIGGTVNVETRKPLDMKDGFSGAGSAEMVESKLADEKDPQLSGMLNWKNDDGTLGINVGLMSEDRTLRRDGIEYPGGFTTFAVADQGGAELRVPSLLGAAYFTQERERTGGTFAAQWKPTDETDLQLNYLTSKLQADNTNGNFMAWFGNLVSSGDQPTNTTRSGDVLTGGTFSDNAAGNGVIYDQFYRKAHTKTQSLDLDGTWSGEDWTLHGKTGKTKAEGNTDRQLVWETFGKSGFTFETHGEPSVIYDRDTFDPATLPNVGWVSDREIGSEDEESFFYADATRHLDSGVFTSLKFGVKYTDHDRNVFFNQTGGNGALYGLNGLAPVAGGTTPGDYLSGMGNMPGYRLVDIGKMIALYNEQVRNAQAAVDAGTLSPEDFHFFNPNGTYDVNEKAWGGFVMGNFEVDKIRGNLGLRIVQTQQNVDGYQGSAPVGAPGQFSNPFGSFMPVSYDKDYTDILPSVNVAYELDSDLVFRFAAAKVMARPNYANLAPTLELDPLAFTGTGGNPNVDPFRANQFDFALEWYPTENLSASATYFHKDIQSYITTEGFQERQVVQIENPAPGQLEAGDCSSAGTQLYDCAFTVNRPANGNGGTNDGIELAIQQSFENGLGYQFNYTWLEANGANGRDIEGASKNSYNIVGFYEDENWSARLAYNYRSEYLTVVDSGRPVYQEPTDTLDMSVSYNITENIALTFEGQNLTDEVLHQYFDGNSDTTYAHYRNGEVYYAGVRVKF